MPIFKNFESGDRLSADWVRTVTETCKKVNRIRGSGGITIHNTPGGITIGADIRNGSERRLAIANANESGDATDWPSFQEWSEADGNSEQQQTVFDFEFIEPAWTNDEDDPRPSTVFPYTRTGEYVRALNTTEHYVPHWLGYGGYVMWLTKSGNQWFADYSLPPIIKIILEGDLYPDNYTDARTTNYELGNPTFRVYDNGLIPITKKWSAGSLGLARLQRTYHQLLTSPIWRYEVYEIFGCPAFAEGE